MNIQNKKLKQDLIAENCEGCLIKLNEKSLKMKLIWFSLYLTLGILISLWNKVYENISINVYLIKK